MTCRCGEKFCYLCGGTIFNPGPYYHERCDICGSPKCTPCKDHRACQREREARRPPSPARTGYTCFGADSIVIVIDKFTGKQRKTTVSKVIEGDEVLTAEGTAIVRVATRTLRSAALRKLPGDLLITNNHPVRINGEWHMPGKLDIAEDFELEKPVYIYNFVLDRSHILLVNGYECITLGHDLKDEFIQHPFYGTERITNSLLTLPVVNGQRTVTAIDEGGKGDYET